MKKILLVLVAVITFAMNGKAQSNIDRLSFGFGCLYQNGLDLTLSYEHEGKYHHMWEFLPTVISNGMNAHPAVISARNHSGGISGVTDSEQPTSLVWRMVATITAMSVSGHRLGVTQNGSWAASTSAMNTIMCFEVAGGCSAR